MAKSSAFGRSSCGLSFCRQGLIIRTQGNEVSKIFADLITNNPNSLQFFPDSCSKRPPPKMYFWKIFSVLEPQQFQAVVRSIIESHQAPGRMPDQIQLTEEAMNIINTLDNSKSLAYLSKLISQEKRKPQQSVDLHRKNSAAVRQKQQLGGTAELRTELWKGLSN